MKPKHLDARGEGEYDYDYKNDLLYFKIKNREYDSSLDFGNLVADIDKEGFITGLRIFDASKILGIPKVALKNVQEFEFNTSAEDNIIKIQLKFIPVLRNKKLLRQGQDFERALTGSEMEDCKVEATTA